MRTPTLYNDYFADITDRETGEVLHQMARVQDHDQHVAVWVSARTVPTVYHLDTVKVATVRNRNGCRHPVCRSKASRARLSRVWRDSGLPPFTPPELEDTAEDTAEDNTQ